MEVVRGGKSSADCAPEPRISLHGISHICGRSSSPCYQVLWRLSFATMLVLLSICCGLSITFYLRYMHITALDEVAAFSLDFPAVTICNVNPVRVSQLTSDDLRWAAPLLGLPGGRGPLWAEPQAGPHNLTQPQDLPVRPWSLQEFLERAGHQLHHMLVQCSFSRQQCSEDDFRPFYHPAIQLLEASVTQYEELPHTSQMPIEIVCKIAFSEDAEKQKGTVECDKKSLIEEACHSTATDLITFADTCSLHGINHVFVAGGCGVKQSLWALAFLSSLLFFLYQVVNCTVFYLHYHHVTALDEESSQEIVFPAITICNMNRFRHTALTDADIYHLANMTGLPPKSKDAHRAVIQEYPEPNMMDIFNRTGHQIEEMLKNCNFSGSHCSPHNFSVVFTRYGKCYTFNANKTNTKKSKQGGMGNGLELMLDIQQDEYLPIWQETDETSFEAGIRVQIHSQHEPPYIHQLGFGVPPGFQTFVSCQEQRLTYLPQPWGTCRSELQGSLVPGYDNYSLAACRINCEKQAVLRECKCRMVHMPGSEPICSPEEYMECADRALDNLITMANFSCKCETPCHITRYNKELSMVKIPSRGSSKFLAKRFNTSEQNIKENYLVLDIYFEALNYETIEQKKAYDVAGLLGDIGGHMGLFIGASILTILEIIDYLYELLRDRLQRVLRPQTPTTKKSQDTIATLGLDDIKLTSCESSRCPPEGRVLPPILCPHSPQHRLPFQDFAC